MKKASVINLVWLGAVIGCVAASWTPGLLGLIAFLLMDLSLRAAEIARCVKSIAAVFSAEPEEMTEERADVLSASIMRRLHEDMRLSAARRGH